MLTFTQDLRIARKLELVQLFWCKVGWSGPIFCDDWWCNADDWKEVWWVWIVCAFALLNFVGLHWKDHSCCKKCVIFIWQFVFRNKLWHEVICTLCAGRRSEVEESGIKWHCFVHSISLPAGNCFHGNTSQLFPPYHLRHRGHHCRAPDRQTSSLRLFFFHVCLRLCVAPEGTGGGGGGLLFSRKDGVLLTTVTLW